MCYQLLNAQSFRLFIPSVITCESCDLRKGKNEALRGVRWQCHPKLSSIVAEESHTKPAAGVRMWTQ